MGARAEDASDLAERLARGDLAALGEAYDAHHTAVRLFACRLVGDDDEEEDLVQETFLALPQAIRSFRGDASLRTFILGIAANRARHHVRAAARRRSMHARAIAPEDEATAPTPEDATRRRELADALTRALDELPFEQRIALVLCEVEERPSAEVAIIVGAPEGTVRTRVFNAKKRLREILRVRGVR